MYDFAKPIIETVEPLHDDIYGPLYRCSLTLKDGTFLPCAILHSRDRLIELAKRRIKEDLSRKGSTAMPDPYGEIIRSFVTHGNRVNDYDVRSASESKYAIPKRLLSEIHGETMMGWTG